MQHSRKATGGINTFNNHSVPFNIPVNYSSEAACAPAGPPSSGTLPPLAHLCML